MDKKIKLNKDGFPAGPHPVRCAGIGGIPGKCTWTGNRTHGALKPCPRCGGVVVWVFK